MAHDRDDIVPLWPDEAGPAGDRPYMTPYLVETTGEAACMIVCPGGGYAGLADHEAEPVARWLNGLGISACVLRYRVAPHRHPAPLHDAQRAIRLARYEAAGWNIDPGRVGILGFSAGGHLAATVATQADHGAATASDPVERQSCRPDAVVLAYPVISFVRFVHEGSMVNLLSEHPDEQTRRLLSSELHVTAGTPPAFLWHTADDAAVDVGNSLLFAAALREHRVPFELHVYESGVHGLGLAPDHPFAGGWTDACARWLGQRSFL